MNLPDVHDSSRQWLMLVRFCATFIGGVFSMMLLATGLVEVSHAYLPARMAQYVNPRSALILTIAVWYFLWTLYLAPEDVEDNTISLSQQLFIPLALLLMLFFATSGLQLEMLESGIRTLPLDYEFLGALNRATPWVITLLLGVMAYYGAKQDYQRQIQSRGK